MGGVKNFLQNGFQKLGINVNEIPTTFLIDIWFPLKHYVVIFLIDSWKIASLG